MAAMIAHAERNQKPNTALDTTAITASVTFIAKIFSNCSSRVARICPGLTNPRSTSHSAETRTNRTASGACIHPHSAGAIA